MTLLVKVACDIVPRSLSPGFLVDAQHEKREAGVSPVLQPRVRVGWARPWLSLLASPSELPDLDAQGAKALQA